MLSLLDKSLWRAIAVRLIRMEKSLTRHYSNHRMNMRLLEFDDVFAQMYRLLPEKFQ